ncbi:MAG TPA: hypothetical protein VMP01_16130 [Pirellulaceae bacterium]|nr:hypothetical protein [Pirellulaceae bacterium]
MSEASRWWRPRFRLASLLWLMLCVALAIGMYRYGYEVGHEDALNQRTFVGNVNPRVYEVSQIVTLKPAGGGVIADFDSLMSDLKKEVLPYTWDDQGGPPQWLNFQPISRSSSPTTKTGTSGLVSGSASDVKQRGIQPPL